MEEQEKIDIREHLIGWIDTLLEDGIVPQVVNPKAIKANYIPKSKIKEKAEGIDKAIPTAQGEELLILEAKKDFAQELLEEE